MAKYDACMESAKYAGRIQASFDEGMKIKVPRRPTFVIGGRMMSGGIPTTTEAHRGLDRAPAAVLQ
jgi:hypothetical protein